MDDFRLIYRILKALQAAMDCDEWDSDRISPEALNVSQTKRDQMLVMMAKEGLIDGLHYKTYITGTAPVVSVSQPVTITFKGLSFLEENNLIRKAANLGKGIKESVPFL